MPGVTDVWSSLHKDDPNQSAPTWLLIANKRANVFFDDVQDSGTGALGAQVPVDVVEMHPVEADIVGYNYQDDDESTIDIMLVYNDSIIYLPAAFGGGVAIAITGGDFSSSPPFINVAGMVNVSIGPYSMFDGNDPWMPFGAGHEMGHALLNSGFAMHGEAAANGLLSNPLSALEILDATKRLSAEEDSKARSESGPGSGGPALLQKDSN